jgi:hypothetical protein
MPPLKISFEVRPAPRADVPRPIGRQSGKSPAKQDPAGLKLDVQFRPLGHTLTGQEPHGETEYRATARMISRYSKCHHAGMDTSANPIIENAERLLKDAEIRAAAGSYRAAISRAVEPNAYPVRSIPPGGSGFSLNLGISFAFTLHWGGLAFSRVPSSAGWCPFEFSAAGGVERK